MVSNTWQLNMWYRYFSASPTGKRQFWSPLGPGAKLKCKAGNPQQTRPDKITLRKIPITTNENYVHYNC